MGSMGHRRHEGRLAVLHEILDESYNCLVVLHARDDDTGKQISGAYEVLKDINDEKAIMDYAKTVEAESGRKVTKIDLYKLKPTLHKSLGSSRK